VDELLREASANPGNIQQEAEKMGRLQFSAYRYSMTAYFRNKGGIGEHLILLLISVSFDTS
jgi:hypothetical protein